MAQEAQGAKGAPARRFMEENKEPPFPFAAGCKTLLLALCDAHFAKTALVFLVTKGMLAKLAESQAKSLMYTGPWIHGFLGGQKSSPLPRALPVWVLSPSPL